VNPLRAIHKTHRDIEYHSARHARTAWTLAMGWNFGLSLAAGVPCALVADALVHRTTPVATIKGRLFVDDAGALDGFVFVDDTRPTGWEQARPYAEFSLAIATSAHGWPSASREDVAVATLSTTHFDPARADPKREKATVRRIVDRALATRNASDRAVALDAIDRIDTPRTQPPLRWGHLAFNALIAWPVLYAVGSAGIGCTWVAHSILEFARTRRRRALRARGLCPACRHRVEGNLWSANCPECGEPLY